MRVALKNIRAFVMSEKRNCVIIIPSLNPEEGLIDYVKELKNSGFDKILLVDDGSRNESKFIFATLKTEYGCDLITHDVNYGKGRALKNAFAYYHNENLSGKYSDCIGVITADSDGQHTVPDVLKLAEALPNCSDSLILGVRDFDNESVPPKSETGNKISRVMLRLFVGGDVTDTQTGLRAVPNSLIERFSLLPGERFEYETKMLIDCIKSKINIKEIPIRTVYIDGNKETHYRPIADSISIFKVIAGTFFKYILSSLSSFLLDYGLFCLILFVAGLFIDNAKEKVAIWIATVIARICSSLFNYFVNKTLVFDSQKGMKTLVYYYILVVVQMAASAALVSLTTSCLPIPAQLSKLIVDTLLFLLSYQIQKRLIFKAE